MKIFLDTANLNEVEDALRKGVISGITTNPSILSKEPKTDFVEHLKKIARLCEKYKQIIPLSVEVITDNPKKMVSEAIKLVEQINYENLNIKIPLSGWEEVEVISDLKKCGIRVNCTCLFNEAQCIIAARAGARYVSLFKGRMRDVGINTDNVISNVRKLLDEENELELEPVCEIIIGSIRHPADITDAFMSGAHIVTADPTNIKKMVVHPKTTESVNQFLNDFQKWLK